MIENNVIINFTSRKDIRELTTFTSRVLEAMGLSILNREVVKLHILPVDHEYKLFINTVVTDVQERAIRNVFKRFEFGIVWSDFDNFGDDE